MLKDDYDAMLTLRKQAREEYESYRHQALKEYEYDYQQYKKLSDIEKNLIEKIQKPSMGMSVSGMITDLASFKFQWYKKRFDSEIKRRCYGQQTFDPDALPPSLDNQIIMNSLGTKLR